MAPSATADGRHDAPPAAVGTASTVKAPAIACNVLSAIFKPSQQTKPASTRVQAAPAAIRQVNAAPSAKRETKMQAICTHLECRRVIGFAADCATFQGYRTPGRMTCPGSGGAKHPEPAAFTRPTRPWSWEDRFGSRG